MCSTFTLDNNYIPGFTTIDHTHLRPFPSPPLSLSGLGLVLLLFVYLGFIRLLGLLLLVTCTQHLVSFLRGAGLLGLHFVPLLHNIHLVV